MGQDRVCKEKEPQPLGRRKEVKLELSCQVFPVAHLAEVMDSELQRLKGA